MTLSNPASSAIPLPLRSVAQNDAEPRGSSERRTPTPVSGRWAQLPFDDVLSYTRSAYPRWITELGQSLFREAMVEQLRQATRHRHPLRRVVDVGCAVGDWTEAYAGFAREVIGVELNPNFLAEAERRLAERRLAVARGSERRGRIAFVQADARLYDDFERADLVCLGAILSCLDDDEARLVLRRIASQQAPGAYLYVRTTVVPPSRREWTSSGGYYRAPYFYRRLLEDWGYRIELSEPSVSVVTAHVVAQTLAPTGHSLARRVTAPLNHLVSAVRALSRNTEYQNWICVRE